MTTAQATTTARQYGSKTVHDRTATTAGGLPVTRCGRTLTDPAPVDLVHAVAGATGCAQCAHRRPTTPEAAAGIGTAYRDAVARLAAQPADQTPAARLSASLAEWGQRERAAAAQPTGPDLLPCDACNADADEPCRPWCLSRPDVDDVATLAADGRADAARTVVRDELARIADELAALADALTAGGPESPEARAAHTAAAALRHAIA